MKELKYEYKGHAISVKKAFGVNKDGYYYDEMFHLTIDKVPYIMFVVGSSYGYGSQVSAINTIDTMKESDKELRFRIDTCVHKDSIRLYVIKKEKILQVISIENAKVISIDQKNQVC